MYTHENGRKIPLRDVQDLAKVRKDRINVYDETGERILKNVDKRTVERKMRGEEMGIFGKVKKAVGQRLDDRAKERTLQKKVEFNEQKRAERAKTETFRRKGLTEEEARFMAEREVKREVDAKKKAETSAKIKKATEAFGEMGREMNRSSPGPAPKKAVHKNTKNTVKRVQQNVKEDIPNPNKLGFKI